VMIFHILAAGASITAATLATMFFITNHFYVT
jgi:hypothetical protein